MSLRDVGGNAWHGTHIAFTHVGCSASGKTQIWAVWSGNIRLGEVRWFATWRKYAFVPDGDTVYEQTCLRELAEFIEARTAAHKVAR